MYRGTAALLLFAIAFALVLPTSHAAPQKGASITLRARWQSTSYLMESAEFLVSVLALGSGG